MPRPSKASPQKPAAKDAASINGHRVQNKILLALPSHESAAILPKLEFVSLPIPTVLNEVRETIKFAFFLNGGLASILSIMADGKSVEVGLCGSEGFVGIPLAAGLRSSAGRTIMQVGGTAFRMRAKDFVAALNKSPHLAIGIQRFTQELAFQSAQVAACNRLHDIDERLARWLLMSQDRLGGDLVPLTQEFLSHMLGTRRASVTVAAGILQKAGIIGYSRGAVRIESRKRLEGASCECYEMITQQVERWHSEVN